VAGRLGYLSLYSSFKATGFLGDHQHSKAVASLMKLRRASATLLCKPRWKPG
jgi:hypothetical protein